MTVHDASVLIPQMRPDGCALVGGAHHHQTWNFELRGERRLREGLDAAHIVSRDQVRIELDPVIEESRWLDSTKEVDGKTQTLDVLFTRVRPSGAPSADEELVIEILMMEVPK